MGVTGRILALVWTADFPGEVSSELGRCFKSTTIKTPLDGPPIVFEKESFSAQKSKKTTPEKKFSFKRKLPGSSDGDNLGKQHMFGTIKFVGQVCNLPMAG
jgi:hypothetical protein